MVAVTGACVIKVMVITMTGMLYLACCVYVCYMYGYVVFAVVLYMIALHYMFDV